MCGGMCVTKVFEAFQRNPALVILKKCPLCGMNILMYADIESAVFDLMKPTRDISGRSRFFFDFICDIVQSEDTESDFCYDYGIWGIVCRNV